MTLEREIGRDLHGELLGVDGTIVCDYKPPHRGTIDPGEPICYEAIQVLASPSLDGRLPLPSGWLLDACRCSDHEIANFPYRTVGFEEALLTLEVVPVEHGLFAVDGESIRLLEVSPADDGTPPVEAPPETAAIAVEYSDYGHDRLTRQMAYLTMHVLTGHAEHAEAIEAAMAQETKRRETDIEADRSA